MQAALRCCDGLPLFGACDLASVAAFAASGLLLFAVRQPGHG